MAAIMPHMLRDPTPARTTAASRLVALACAFALIVLGVGWELAWARTGHGTLALKVLPLVIALPGLSRHRMYTYRWLALVVWLYVADGAVRLADPPPVNVLAALEIALAMVLFAACATQVRSRLAAARRARAGDGDERPPGGPDGRTQQSPSARRLSDDRLAG